MSSRHQIYTHSHQRGFTLIEILVVVVILGILAALIVPNVIKRPDDARLVAVNSDLRNIKNALDLYRLDNQRYPATDEGLAALVNKYLDQVPKDPWKTPYQYLNPGLHGEVDIYSLGADKQAGGEGMNADIGSWQLNE